MDRFRLLAVSVLVATVAACSGSGGTVPLTRSEAAAPAPTTISTTSAPAVSPGDGSLPRPAETASAPLDPIPLGAATPVRARSHRSRPGKPQPTGHIEIPAIGLSHSTYEGIDLATINHGPSHWPGSALPGRRGNSVFAGHRTTYSRPFWSINELAPGDEVIFTTAAGRFVYRVTKAFVVHSRDTSIIEPTEDPTFTIFACHPRGSARQRYVVQGALASSAPSKPPAPTTTTTTTTSTTAPPEQRPGGILGLGGSSG